MNRGPKLKVAGGRRREEERDEDRYFTVSKVLAHRGGPTSQTPSERWEVLIQWAPSKTGAVTYEPTWEPLKVIFSMVAIDVEIFLTALP
jgi:hypothetical protein